MADGIWPKIGSWSFIVGVFLAVVMAFFRPTVAAVTALIILGTVVGFLNISGEKAMTFLMASVSLVIISALGGGAFSSAALVGELMEKALGNLIVFVVPASLIVAMRAVLTIAYNK